MAHLLQIQNRTRIIETKAKELFREIQSNYKQGLIKSQTDYLYQVYHGLQEFYDSIGKPTVTYRPAYGPPFSKDYNQTMNEVYHDLVTLFAEMGEISVTLNESFRQIEIDRQSLNHRLKKVEDSVKELRLKRNQKTTEILFRDSFIDQSTYDKEMVEGVLANLWTRERILTLQPKAAQSFAQDCSIRILEGNGFPGNTHQVRSLSGDIKFVGEDNLHIDLSEILDNNLDTWFEYELFEVDHETTKRTAGLGFEYEEDIKWVMEGQESLRLVIEMELPVAQTINWFSIRPFIPNDKGAMAAFIQSIQIDDGKGNVSNVLPDAETFDEEKVVLFKQQSCKRIRVLIEQPSSYDTSIGHLFFRESNRADLNFLDDLEDTDGKRIDGVMPSIENVEVRYDPENQKLIHPSMNPGDKIPDTELRKQNLFSLPESKEGSKPGFEILPGERYVIGIRDAGISNYQFIDSGEYRTINFYSPSEMKMISLEVDSYIPPEFGEGKWIEYFITVDNGQSWHSILPRGTSDEGKVMYLLNTNTPQEGRLSEFGYLDTGNPIHGVRLMIKLKRPVSKGNEYYTPIIKDYQLRVVTRGDE